jgi:hypothetical protein
MPRKIKPTPSHVEWEDHGDGTYTAWFSWAGKGIDRPCDHGIMVNSEAMVDRLAYAFADGVLFDIPEVKTDIYGKTYVSAALKVRGRCVNADLRKLGY